MAVVNGRRGAAVGAALAAAAVSGCATISGRSQRVAVDAEPRGGAVQEAAAPEGPRLAVATPTVVELPRAASHELVFEAPPGSGPPHTVAVDCDFRWRVVGLGNLPFAVASLSTYGVGYAIGVGVDLWTGAAWDCPLVITPPGTAGGPAAAAPRRLFVLPPAVDDTAAQDALARAWRTAVKPALGPEDAVILPGSHRALLTRLGDPQKPADLTRQRLNTLLMETGATHLVRLMYHPSPGGTRFTAELYDAYRERAEPAVAVMGPPVDTGASEFGWHTVFEYLHFIPNSVAWLPGVTNFQPTAAEDGATAGATANASLPAWVSGFTLTSADHPDAYEAWDAHGKLEPAVGLNAIDADVRITGRKTAAGEALPDVRDRFEAWLVRAWYELGGTLHTPMGAFDLALLGGYAVAWQDAFAGEDARTRGRVELGAGLRWTAFLSERVYFRAGAQSFSPVNPLLETDLFRSKGVVQAWAGLGVYLPEPRWWVRSIFR